MTDLHRDMKIQVTTTYTTTPASLVEPYAGGRRTLYAFPVGTYNADPSPSGCICNACAADPASVARVKRATVRDYGTPIDAELAKLDDERTSYWSCTVCHLYDERRRR